MENINPKTKASWFSLLFLTYTFDIFRKGSKNLWTNENLYSPLDSHRSSQLGKRVEREWENHVHICKKKNKLPNVNRVLLKIFWPNLCFDGCLVLLHQLSRLPEPFLLGLFLSKFNKNFQLIDYETQWCVALMICFGGLRTLLFSQMRGASHDTAVKVRSSCNGLILRKILRMSKSVLQDKASGNILNLISNDLNRLDVTVFLIHQVWVIPFSMLGILYLLYFNLGLSGLSGVMWFILPMILQVFFAKQIAVFRRKIAELTGKRLKLMNEMLTGIQIIKMYTWEKNFSKFINLSRISELNIIKKSNYFKFLIPSVVAFVSVSAIFAAIFTMIKTDSKASVAELYSLVAYYAFLNNSITQMLPASIMRIVDLHQTFLRIGSFMLSEEIDYEKEMSTNNNISPDVKIVLENIHAQWVVLEGNHKAKSDSNYKEEEDILIEKTHLMPKREVGVLRNINLKLKEKEFVGIVGPVGSGKTSLLSTILGETFVSSGQKIVNGSISYAAQESWIFDGTIRDNILFHEPFETSRYTEVLRVCGLEKDMGLFPKADLTQVGERGVCLSGGQKARINLARTVYKKADIYLLDDPLSSLDIHVCKYLVVECFQKFLANKCRILVTHHLQFLEDCSWILVLDLGDVKGIGTFQDLQQKGILNVSDSNLEMEDKTSDVIENRTVEMNSIPGNVENEVRAQTIPKPNPTNKQKYFFAYLNSGGQSALVVLVSLLFIFCQMTDTSFYVFLGYWTHVRDQKHVNMSYVYEVENSLLEWNDGMNIFGGLIIALGILSVFRGILYCRMVIRNSKMLHSNMLEKTIGGKTEFFHQNTSGHILSWFSKDLGIVDEILPRNVLDTSIQALSLSSRLLVVAYVNPYLLVVIGIMVLVLPRLLHTYRNTARNISRIEGSSMAPVLTHINAVIKGLSTIRASQAEKMIITEFDKHQDRYLTSWYMFATVFNAFGFSVDLITFFFISIVTVTCFLMQNAIGLNGSQIGLAITQAMGLATYLQYGLLQFVQTDNSLVALERILEYKKIPQDVKPAELKLPEGWPMDGKITFREVKVKYDEDQPAVLKNLNFCIQPKEKIGIVGRTGAGKTSIISALFRMVPSIVGIIEIDGYDTRDVPLDLLRSHISIIPQDSVLFSATLRYNLDPFGECSDSDLYKALKEVDLEKTGCAVKELYDRIEENGANLSVGQKQLINLARAILKRNRIIVLDEATSNIDSVTDDLIQSTIRRNFADCTVITIAHRISTVMDSDKIMVIEAGELIEFDQPQILLRNKEGSFYKMVNQK